MGKLIAYESVTLDGVMQAPGGADEDTRGGFTHGWWSAPYFDEVMLQHSTGGEVAECRLIIGRRTSEQFFSFWPHQSDNPYSDVLAKSRKYVASTTHYDTVPWNNTALLS